MDLNTVRLQPLTLAWLDQRLPNFFQTTYEKITIVWMIWFLAASC